jgi:hypothetical protein
VIYYNFLRLSGSIFPSTTDIGGRIVTLKDIENRIVTPIYIEERILTIFKNLNENRDSCGH